MKFDTKKVMIADSLIHHVPTLPEGAERPKNIPISYFEKRVEEIHKVLRERIETVTSTHNQSDQKRELADLEKLKNGVMASLAAARFEVIRSRAVLDMTCGELTEAAGPIGFYKRRNEKLRSIVTQFDQMLKAERQAINDIFDLPERYDPANGETAGPTEQVAIHLNEEERRRRETEALLDRVKKNPKRYSQLEKLYEIILIELNEIINQLKPLEDLQEELIKYLAVVKDQKEKAKESLEEAEKKVPEIQSALGVMPSLAVMNGLPPAIKEATLDTYRKYVALFLPANELKKACAQIRERIDQFNEEKDIFQKVLSDHEMNFILKRSAARIFLGERYDNFMKLKTIFEGLEQEIKEASRVVDNSEKEINSLLNKKKIKETLSQVVPFADDELRLIMQQLFESYSKKSKNSGRKGRTDRKERRPIFRLKNKTLEQIGEAFDARIASRLSRAVQIHFTGADRRNND